MKYRAGQRKKTCFFKKRPFRPNSSARIIFTVRYDGYDKNSTGQTKMEPGVTDARLMGRRALLSVRARPEWARLSERAHLRPGGDGLPGRKGFFRLLSALGSAP